MPNVKPVPEGFHSITPNLVFQNAVAAIDFYKQVFGATETVRMPGPDGKVMHAELKIGDSIIFVNDAMGQIAPSAGQGASNPMDLHLYVPEVDVLFNRGVAAGASGDLPVKLISWGHRYRKTTDPPVWQCRVPER